MIWKDIPNFEGYQVSDTGMVRTHNKVTHTDWHGDRHWKDRILKPKKSLKGRADDRVDLWKDGKPHSLKVSRLVAFTFYGADINDHSLTVNHIDGDYENNCIDNLELVSLKDNIGHAFDTGLMSSCIRIRLVDKMTYDELACRSEAEADRRMGRCHGYIHSKIKKGIFEDDSFSWEIIEN